MGYYYGTLNSLKCIKYYAKRGRNLSVKHDDNFNENLLKKNFFNDLANLSLSEVYCSSMYLSAVQFHNQN